MAYSIGKKEIAPQPVLVVRRRVKPTEIAATLGEVLGHVFLHAQKNGIALAGHPFTRYVEWGPGLLTIEAGLPVAAHSGAGSEGQIRAETLPGGFVATTIHAGPYDNSPKLTPRFSNGSKRKGFTRRAGVGSVCDRSGGLSRSQDWKTEIFLAARRPPGHSTIN